MRSMTGFGSAHESTPNLDVEVSLRSVNGRFLDLRFHLPKEYIGFEGEFRQLLQKNLSRGSVDIFVQRKAQKTRKVHFDDSLAKSWLAGAKALGKKLNLNTEMTLKDLVQSAPILTVEESSSLDSQEKKSVVALFKKSLQALESSREREGAALKSHLKTLLQTLTKSVSDLEKCRAEARVEVQKKWEERWQSWPELIQLDPQKYTQEVMTFVERSDISEELIRLREHVSEMTRLASVEECIGKKLDFYSQELLREINTIGSKSSKAELTQLVVDAKSIIEQIKEQVQNIE